MFHFYGVHIVPFFRRADRSLRWASATKEARRMAGLRVYKTRL
jgi:hypothetical protein